MHQSTIVKNIEQQLESHGWKQGAPAHVAPAIVDCDRRIGRNMKCGECHRRGMRFVPLNRAGVYRAVLICTCGNHEEL